MGRPGRVLQLLATNTCAGERLAIGSTCEFWASAIRFRAVQRTGAAALGGRLERCGAGRGAHRRPEPRARVYQPARSQGSAAGSLPRDETLYTSGTATSPPSNFNPLDLSGAYTGPRACSTSRCSFTTRCMASSSRGWLRSGAWARADDVQTSGPRERGLDGEPERSSNGGPQRGRCRLHRQSRHGGQGRPLQRRRGQRDRARRQWAIPSQSSSASPSATRSGKISFGIRRCYRKPRGRPLRPQARLTGANKAPVSTGPMLLRSTSPTEACYQDNPHWWGKNQLGLSFKFEYLCDTVSGSSGAGLSALLESRTDWSNALLEGVTNLAGGKTASYDIKTYYPGAPVHAPGRERRGSK